MRVTMTGVDAKTDISSLPNGVEYAVLYTETPEGRNRYPDHSQVVSILRELREMGHDTALHVCGSIARYYLIDSQITHITEHVGRIQVNGFVNKITLAEICEQYPGHEIITQHSQKNWQLLGCDSERFKNHSILVDGSGGRGISPKQWVRPDTPKRVGFAGGIGPDNVADELEKILQVSQGDSWIDMETKLRDQGDWFSADLAWSVMNAIPKTE